MRFAMLSAVLGLALVLGGCATTTPKKTLADLDRKDPRWDSRACKKARADAAAYDDNKEGRVVVAVLGNLAIPFAGSAAAFAMDRMQDDERKALSHKVRAACVSDPLKKKRRGRR